MTSQSICYASGDRTQFHFSATLKDLLEAAPPEQCILITDEHLAGIYGEILSDYRLISFPPGEENKSLPSLEILTEKLLGLRANRQTMLLGLGGGVVTDMVGYLAASYMRGVPFGFVPTTLLSQVDAAIGGKNGVNVGLHKNMLGVVKQPNHIFFSCEWLKSLPEQHWQAGFAEIIKYSYIADTRILSLLQQTTINRFRRQPDELETLIQDCVFIKNKIVLADEHESGIRRILNFGHSAGHALERLYALPHGHAVGLGMRVALRLSEIHTGLAAETSEQLLQLLEKYGLPTRLPHDEKAVIDLLLNDKKSRDKGIDYVLLEKPGVPVLKNLQAAQIREALPVLN
ncbi:MAG: 3-dehydroquinate synthase [Bacteroidetes bacterium]|nr:3-dehydroquinate synthase [Bacteroidota bacterium]